MSLTRPLILASASPRRREILGNLGLAFSTEPADLDETQHAGEAPDRYVMRLALEKAASVARTLSEPFAVLGADTTVVLAGEVMGKPTGAAESEAMLRKLRGRRHVVHTGVALVLWPEQSERVTLVSTEVGFRAFDDDTLRRYVASGEGLDKAGSYGIQELGAALVSTVHGSYSNVVGLPAAETIELLQGSGVLDGWP